MLTNLSIDSLYEICSFLSTSELLKFSFTCSLYYNCLLKDVRIMKEHKFTLKDNIDELDFMDCMSYKILNLDLNSNANITDDNFTYLKGIHTLNMSGCQEITDQGLIHLKGIHTLNMLGCGEITNEGLIPFKCIKPSSVIPLHPDILSV